MIDTIPVYFGELKIVGLIDTSALSSASSEVDLEQIKQIALPQRENLIEAPPLHFQMMMANR